MQLSYFQNMSSLRLNCNSNTNASELPIPLLQELSYESYPSAVLVLSLICQILRQNKAQVERFNFLAYRGSIRALKGV